ncbi:MAG: PA2169 family four-helix-bundle protein [Anaerolineaceae bacterium]|nr:PA2169 family four-helix-bundle protein [Anaerolineaceae bacterium]
MDTEANTSPSVDEVDKLLIQLLNGLILVCHDAHDGYMQAADSITSSAYKTMFAEYALERSRFAAQLANVILDHGGDPDDDGHAMSMFSRGWTNIKPVLMGGDYGAIFAECERSEGIAKNAYERVLGKQIATDAYVVVNHQFKQIEEAHDRIRNLREAYYLEHKN